MRVVLIRHIANQEDGMESKKLDTLLRSLPSAGIPGGELIITHKGETVYHNVFGVSDTDTAKPTSKSDIYWLYSTSKVITCMSALQLIEKGKMSLDDPVWKYIPAYKNLKVKDKDGSIRDARSVMTLEHLFTMCGGLSYDKETPEILGAEDRSTYGIVSAIAKTPLLFDPGEHFEYSLCHDVLGAVIEVVSEMTLGEYMKKNVFDPLEIKDMGFHPTPDQQKRIVPLYLYENGECVSHKHKIQRNTYMLSDIFDSGGAGLFGTTEEYSRIINALSIGGTAKNGYKLLSEDTLKTMESYRLPKAPLEDFGVKVGRFGYSFGLCGRVHG